MHVYAPVVDWDAVCALVATAADDGLLPVLHSPILLQRGEVLHGIGEAQGWRFRPADVQYDTNRIGPAGSLLTFGLAAVATGIGNRRTRERAERLAAPQWRPLGILPTFATNQRLLIWHESAWASVWYSGIVQAFPAFEHSRLELIFEQDDPYLLVGPWVPYLTVILLTVLAQDRGVEAVRNALAVSAA